MKGAEGGYRLENGLYVDLLLSAANRAAGEEDLAIGTTEPSPSFGEVVEGVEIERLIESVLLSHTR